MIETLMPSRAELVMGGQILLAFLFGGLIGFEREAARKSAGLRTHMLVAAGTTAFTLVSIYGFQTSDGAPRDPARVAAQVVSGIGYLGAGTIFRDGDRVRGLTSAATIWLAAALGMLIGAGLYWLGIFTTFASLVELRFVRLRFGLDAEVDEVPRMEQGDGAR